MGLLCHRGGGSFELFGASPHSHACFLKAKTAEAEVVSVQGLMREQDALELDISNRLQGMTNEERKTEQRRRHMRQALAQVRKCEGWEGFGRRGSGEGKAAPKGGMGRRGIRG